MIKFLKIKKLRNYLKIIKFKNYSYLNASIGFSFDARLAG